MHLADHPTEDKILDGRMVGNVLTRNSGGTESET